jgi:ribosomal protein S3
VYQKSNLNDSSFLVTNYVLYLVFKKTSSSKQILRIIYNTLKEQSYKRKIIYTIRGLQLVQLKGFKLEFTGCFESSRSQMSKTLKCSFGSVPLTKLNGYVDYSSNYFLTKFGSCGFKL